MKRKIIFKRSNRSHVAPLVAGAITSAPKIIDTVKKIASVVGVGGVTQDRFFDRYYEIKDWFKNAGYPVSGATHDSMLTKHKIRKTQVEDKKKNGNYQAEFDRLHGWIVDMLNTYNPGLGNYWKSIQPSLPLVNLGNIEGASLASLKEIIAKYPPGSYGGEPIATKVATVKAAPGQTTSDVITDILNQAQQISGNFKQSDVALGPNVLTQPNAAQQTGQTMPTVKAFGKEVPITYILLGLGVLGGVGYFVKRNG